MNRRQLLSSAAVLAVPSVGEARTQGWSERYPELPKDLVADIYVAFWEACGASVERCLCGKCDGVILRPGDGDEPLGADFTIYRQFGGDHDGQPLMKATLREPVFDITDTLHNNPYAISAAKHAGEEIRKAAAKWSPWIPLSERRPEVGQTVVFGYTDLGDGRWSSVQTWNQAWETAGHQNPHPWPTHWMAIPEVPR